MLQISFLGVSRSISNIFCFWSRFCHLTSGVHSDLFPEMSLDDLIPTIDSDAEDDIEQPLKQSATKQKYKPAKAGKATISVEDKPEDKDTLNPEFTFDVTGDIYADVLDGPDGFNDLIQGSKSVSTHVLFYKYKAHMNEGAYLCRRHYCTEKAEQYIQKT